MDQPRESTWRALQAASVFLVLGGVERYQASDLYTGKADADPAIEE